MGDSQGALIRLRGDLNNQIGALNPDFKAADAQYAKFASQGSAAQQGAAATGIRVTPEQAQAAVANTGNNLPHFQQGYASSLADQVERGRDSSNPYNMIFGSMGQRAKIGTVFPQGAAQFGRANALEGDMSKTAYETLGGSPTQLRNEADKSFEADPSGAAIDLGLMAAGHPPINLFRKGLNSAADWWKLGRGRAKADAIGPMLLNQDPAASLTSLDSLIKAGLARRAYVQQTNALGGLLAAPAIYGASSRP
jgi:hypothetical protein